MERKFVLNRSFANFLEGGGPTAPHQTTTSWHFNTPWTIEVVLRHNTAEFRLKCPLANESNLWSVDVEYTFSVVTPAADTENQKKLTPVPLRDVFNCQSKHGQIWAVSLPEINDCLVEGVLKVICEVSIIKIHGVRQKRKQTFDEQIDGLTDVVLVIGDRKFYASKPILANMSPVFKAMFFGNFQESKMTVVEIGDVEPEDFESLLSFIYHASVDVNSSNVVRMLKIADRFDVEPLKSFCEQFLIKARNVSMQDRLRLSEEFKLPELQDACLKTFRNGIRMREVLTDIDKMGELTLKALLKKALSLF